ncbi:MAG: hypothetical protein JSV91_05455 [Phycisphaerales bacterium]|nr:MAG: hypothetical protein JSV91_05455 [Phycisphaerales bacterium]
MALIKHAKAESMAKTALVLDLGDLQREADRILERAQQEAQTILGEAEARAAKIDAAAGEKGYAEGHARGLQEGRDQGRQEGRTEVIEQLKPQAEQIASGWADALERWDTDRKEMFLAARGDVLRFAAAMAEKIIFSVIKTDSTVIERQLAEALSLISRPTSVLIAINPEDRPVAEAILGTLLDKIGRCEQGELVEDASVTRGGCLITTAGGSIDATIETQVRRIVEALMPAAEPPLPPEAPEQDAEPAGGP